MPEAAAPELPAMVPRMSGRRLVVAEPPDPAASLAELGYKPALEQYSRQILTAGLHQGQGCFAEAGRLLGMTPDNLRAKLRGSLLNGEEN